MKNRIQIKYLIGALLLVSINCYAQKGYPSRDANNYWDIRDSLDERYDKKEDTLNKQLHIELSLDYMNKVVYRGRNFGTDQYGIQPMVYLYFGNGLYINYNNYYWGGLPNKWAKTDLGFGYEKELNKYFSFSLGYERWWFRNGDKAEINNLKHFTDASISFFSDYIAIDLSNYYMWGKTSFWINSLELSHEFTLYQWKPGHSVSFIPRATAIFGTNKHSNLIYKDIYTPYIKEITRYEALDYELELPLSFKLNHFNVTPSFHIAHPMNPGDEDPYVLPQFNYFTLQLKYSIYPGIKLGSK